MCLLKRCLLIIIKHDVSNAFDFLHKVLYFFLFQCGSVAVLVWTKLGPLWDELKNNLELIKSGRTLEALENHTHVFCVSHMDPLIIRIKINRDPIP